MRRSQRNPGRSFAWLRQLAGLTAVIALSLVSVATAQTTPTALPPTTDEAPRYRAYPLRQIDANTAQQKLSQFFARSPGVETVADSPRNRVLVHGTDQDLRSAELLLAQLDPPLAKPQAPAATPPPAQQLEAYELTPA